jgi:BirA family biotin operon repressor/biotin-[acetyl-CoA-carboxylase] ligase
MTLGEPREHYETLTSTNERARELAETGAPHGAMVTADEQTAGRGRQGRSWVTPRGQAIAASIVLRDYDDLLPLRAGLAVADVAGPSALVKWPNDVWLDGRKVAGILVEARADPGWAVLGIGVNVAVDPDTLPPDAAEVAGTLGLTPGDVEPTLTKLLDAPERSIAGHARRAARTRRAARQACRVAGRRRHRRRRRRHRRAPGDARRWHHDDAVGRRSDAHIAAGLIVLRT